MSPIYLDSLDEFMLARIVKKFNSVHTGANFYRSCRGARDLVDRIKPVWPFPRHRLPYMNHSRMLRARGKTGTFSDLLGYYFGRGVEKRIKVKPLPPFEWCRIDDLFVGSCSDNYFTDVLVPEIKAMGAVRRVHLTEKLSEEQMQQVMAAANPQLVFLSLYAHDIMSATLKDVKKLHVRADDGQKEADFWKSKKMFELMTSKKTITWSFCYFWKKCIIPFLQNWLKGELTGSWEKLTIKLWNREVQLVEMEEVLNEPEIKNLMRSCAKLPNGYILERKAGGQLRISIDSDDRQIDFSFL